MGKTLRSIAMALGILPTALGIGCSGKNVQLIIPPQPTKATPVLTDDSCSKVCRKERVIYSQELGGAVLEYDCNDYDVAKEARFPAQDLFAAGSSELVVYFTGSETADATSDMLVHYETVGTTGDATNTPVGWSELLDARVDVADAVGDATDLVRWPHDKYDMAATELNKNMDITDILYTDDQVTVERDYDMSCATFAVYKK